MTKREFVDLLASKSTLSRQDAERVLNAVLAALEDGLFRDGRAPLPGLGILAVRERPARAGRNPRTGEAIQIPAQKNVLFRPVSGLAALLRR